MRIVKVAVNVFGLASVEVDGMGRSDCVSGRVKISVEGRLPKPL